MAREWAFQVGIRLSFWPIGGLSPKLAGTRRGDTSALVPPVHSVT